MFARLRLGVGFRGLRGDFFGPSFALPCLLVGCFRSWSWSWKWRVPPTACRSRRNVGFSPESKSLCDSLLGVLGRGTKPNVPAGVLFWGCVLKGNQTEHHFFGGSRTKRHAQVDLAARIFLGLCMQAGGLPKLQAQSVLARVEQAELFRLCSTCRC